MVSYSVYFNPFSKNYSVHSIDDIFNIFHTSIDTLIACYDFLTEDQIIEDIYLFNGYLDKYKAIYFNTEEQVENYIRYISDKYNVMQKLTD